ncbi:MAG: hypothetical protein EON90_09300 [Brevundimonas sp.]|nr:MAG: hypothetical protein EON90_09300 [Brevundimonas sp.]
MRSAIALSGLLAASVLASGCTFLPSDLRPDASSPAGALERAETARARADRMHPACRDQRVDRDDQNDGCSEVARRRW